MSDTSCAQILGTPALVLIDAANVSLGTLANSVDPIHRGHCEADAANVREALRQREVLLRVIRAFLRTSGASGKLPEMFKGWIDELCPMGE